MEPEEALAALDRLASGAPPPARDVVDGLAAGVAASVAAHWPGDFAPPAEGAHDLVALPCPRPARDEHLERLCLALVGPDGPARDAKVRYHARWLTHLFDPGPATTPKVSIVIPVYNRARLVGEAVETCLAQSYANLEIIVVDDGSTDDPAAALAPHGGRVRLIRQANGGVSAARNTGIAAATGEFVQLLDSDDLLHHEAIESKVRAFTAVPDAELCMCAATDVSLCGAAADFGLGPGYANFLPLGDATCPTRDLMAAVCHRFPFFMGSLLAPRWVLLDTGPFDTELAKHEDYRYSFRLGLRGTKVVALRGRLIYRCRMDEGLSMPNRAMRHCAALAWARGVADLLARPALWPLAAHVVGTSWLSTFWDALIDDPDRGLDACRDLLLQAVTGLVDAGRAEALSPLPVLMFLWLRLERTKALRGRDTVRGSAFGAALERALIAGIEATPAAGVRDEAAWRRHCSAPDVDDKVRAALTQGRPPPCAAPHKAKVRAALAFMRDAAGRPDAPRPSLRRRMRRAALGVAALRSRIRGRTWHPPPRVTLVIPVLGDAQAAEATVRSCLRQSYPEIEVLVLDGDEARLRDWRERFRDIRCVRLVDPEGGAVFARNVGSREASGQFVRFLEPGERLGPEAIHDQFRARRRAGGGGTALVGSFPDFAGPPDRATVRPFADLVADGLEPPLSALLLPRWIIDKVGGFDSVLGQAHELRYRVRLAAAGVECALLHAPSATWSQACAHDPAGASAVQLASLANVAQSLAAPRLWPCLPVLARPLVEPSAPAPDALTRDGLVARHWRHVNGIVGELGVGKRLEDRSPLPALALCLGGLVPAVAGEPAECAALRAALLDAAATAAPMEPGEAANPHDPVGRRGATAIKDASAYVARHRPDSPLAPLLREFVRRQSGF